MFPRVATIIAAMFAQAYGAAIAIIVGSVLVGRAVCAVCGGPRRWGAAPLVGLSALLVLADAAIKLPGKAQTASVVCIGAVLASAAFLVWHAAQDTGAGCGPDPAPRLPLHAARPCLPIGALGRRRRNRRVAGRRVYPVSGQRAGRAGRGDRQRPGDSPSGRGGAALVAHGGDLERVVGLSHGTARRCRRRRDERRPAARHGVHRLIARGRRAHRDGCGGSAGVRGHMAAGDDRCAVLAGLPRGRLLRRGCVQGDDHGRAAARLRATSGAGLRRMGASHAPAALRDVSARWIARGGGDLHVQLSRRSLDGSDGGGLGGG